MNRGRISSQLTGAFLLLSFYSLFFSCIAPRRSFEETKKPSPPDYTQSKYWAALPAIKDSADVVPAGSGVKNGQDNAKADVFFLYPTLYVTGRSWNADVNDRKLNKRIDMTTIRNQASVFNGSCKVYAPRYRQAVLYSYLDKKGNGKMAMDLAYEDVKAAFEYYLKNYNNGRPLILASHSQGSHHAFRLIRDYFEKDSLLSRKLICAYLIGATVEQDFAAIPPCDSADQTGCMVAWRSAKWGTPEDKFFFQPSRFCTNPLSWKRDTVYVTAKNNLGGLPFRAKRMDPEIADARISNNILWVHKPKKKGYFRNSRNYHLMDYNLFWMNIRQNVQQRVDRYLAPH